MVTEGSNLTDGSASFLRAARAGNLEKVLEFLKTNTDINTCNANGLNALHLASKEGHTHVVSALLERDASVDSATKKGNTALHIASLSGQEDIVKVLVEHGASVNIQSQNGFTPLYMAAQEDHDSVVRFLLANGANQSLATEEGFTPLAVALQQGHNKVVSVLLENDTRGKVRLPALHIAAKKDDAKAAALLLLTDHNPDVTSKSGFTPLHIASHYGNQNIAALLIQRGADVNYVAKHLINPLHVASKWGKGNMVSLLIERGANIEAKTRDGLTPLHCAARSGHETVVDMLLEKGAPITAKTKNGLAPLHMASQGDHVDAARILLYHKAPVDDVTVDFLTALHVAAHCGHVRVAKLLLDRKADANARALNGFTPLHIACKKNRIKVVELLLKHGASIETTTESGLTPLHVASFMGCMNIVIYLIQHSCSVDVPTVRGETPLHLAARANQTDIIRILLRNGAQVDARARQSALHIASRLGNADIAVLLLQHGATVDANTKDHYTPLHIACKEGQEEVCTVLLDQGASNSEVTKKGFTPLHLASKYGQLKVVKLLLQRDSSVDAQGKNNVTPLHVAAHYDHQNVALLLLDKGASPHATAKNGYTPLHIAARKNQMDIAATLLEYGARSDAESRAGFTPLHLAAQEGHTEMTSLLIEHKTDVGAHARNGLTPLHLAAQEDKVGVGAILVKNGAKIDPETKAGYTPLHVACHFGQMNMVRFLLQHGAIVDVPTQLGYTPLHQASQQGHTQIINLLLENKAEPNMETKDGKTALSIAQRLGYISVVETLKIVTETKVTTNTTTVTEEKYKVVVPETMHETFLSESEDEGGDDTMLGEHSYRFLTVDEMKSLGDDSLPIDDRMDVSFQSTNLSAPLHPTGDHSPQTVKYNYNYPIDNVDVARAPVLAGVESLNTTMNTTLNTSMALEETHINSEEALTSPLDTSLPEQDHNLPTVTANSRMTPEVLNTFQESVTPTESINGWDQFLVSFMVDARGGAMRGCRHSGVRVIIPPRKAAMPMRITCRYLKKDKLVHAPPLMEGEALSSRILEMGPSSAKFLGPVIIEVPHFASLRGKEREIVILRSDNGETWKEHTLEATEEAVQDVLNESFDGEELKQLEDLNTNRITRILTTDFPQYFAIVTRIRQEVHAIGPEGGMVSSTVVPQVQAVFPHGALTKKIKVGLQAQPISPELVAKLLGNRVAVSPIVTVEPRRRKFHKPITLTIPVPQAASKGMINQYSGETPTLRLLCSITGGTSRAVWEDVTGSTPLTLVNDCVSFTTTVSARFWLMDCTNIPEATKMATELYREAIHVPFMSKFVVFSKRHQVEEARVRVFCMTDDKEDKTLETQEQFIEVAKSRDVEVLEGKSQYLEFGGNIVPVTKSGEQLAFNFYAFRENRLPFTVRVKDVNAEPVGRVAFMRQPKVGRGDPPQNPICNLNLSLPANVQPDLAPSEPDLLSLERKYAFLSISKADTIHKADLRLSDIANMLSNDWVPLAKELEVKESDINIIRSQYPENPGQQAIVMLRLWMQTAENKATGNTLEKSLRNIDRNDIVDKCIFNVELVTDDLEMAVAQNQLDHSGFQALQDELGTSTDAPIITKKSIDTSLDERDIMKEAESADEEEIKKTLKDFRKEDDMSPTYEREEKKYAGEEKSYSIEEKTMHEEHSNKFDKETKFQMNQHSETIIPDEGKRVIEDSKLKEADKLSKEETYSHEKKFAIETRDKEGERVEVTTKKIDDSYQQHEQKSHEQESEKNLIEDQPGFSMKTSEKVYEKSDFKTSRESRHSQERTTVEVDKHPFDLGKEVSEEVITAEKKQSPVDISSSVKQMPKEEMLQKLGEELGRLDEKLDEKFRTKMSYGNNEDWSTQLSGSNQTEDIITPQSREKCLTDVQPVKNVSIENKVLNQGSETTDYSQSEASLDGKDKDVGVVFTVPSKSLGGEKCTKKSEQYGESIGDHVDITSFNKPYIPITDKDTPTLKTKQHELDTSSSRFTVESTTKIPKYDISLPDISTKDVKTKRKLFEDEIKKQSIEKDSMKKKSKDDSPTQSSSSDSANFCEVQEIQETEINKPADKNTEKTVEEVRRVVGVTEELLVRETTTTKEGLQEQRVVKETKTQKTKLPDGSTVKTTSITTFTTEMERQDSQTSGCSADEQILEKNVEKQIKADLITDALHSVCDESSPEKKIISPTSQDLKFTILSDKDASSPRSDLTTDEARNLAIDIVEVVKSQALKRSPLSPLEVCSSEMPASSKEYTSHTTSAENNSKIENFIKEKIEDSSLDNGGIEMLESVLALKTKPSTKKSELPQLSLEITDEDLRSSCADFSPVEHQMERLRQMTEEDDLLIAGKEPSEPDESESSLIIHETVDNRFTVGYDQANLMFGSTLDSIRGSSLKEERTIDTISEEPDHLVSSFVTKDRTLKKEISRENLEETAKQIVENVTSQAKKSELIKQKSSQDESYQQPISLADCSPKQQIKSVMKSGESVMESSMTESMEECSAAESSRTYDAKSASETSQLPIKEISEPSSEKIITNNQQEEVKYRRKTHIDEFNRRSGTDIDAYSSSGESHYFTPAEGTSDSRSASRPCSSDVDGLLSLVTGTSEYDTALTSQETSGSIDFSTAPSSISSRDSMRSVDSESSGNLASLELSSEASETLVPSSLDIDKDLDILDTDDLDRLPPDHSYSNLPKNSELPKVGVKTTDYATSSDDGDFDQPTDTKRISSKMKRSMEMTFYPESALLKDDSEPIDHSSVMEESTVSEISVATVIDAAAIPKDIDIIKLDGIPVQQYSSSQINISKMCSVEKQDACNETTESLSQPPSSVTMTVTSVHNLQNSEAPPSISTQVTSKVINEAKTEKDFFSSDGPTESKAKSDLSDRLGNAPATTVNSKGALGGHSEGPVFSKLEPEVDQEFSFMRIDSQSDDYLESELLYESNDYPEAEMTEHLSCVDPIERPKTPEPGATPKYSGNIFVDSPDFRKEEENQRFSAIFSVTYEDPESPAPFKKHQEEEVPNIMITEHLAPIEEKYRYPDLECEEDFPECKVESGSHSTFNSPKSSTTDSEQGREYCLESVRQARLPFDDSFEMIEESEILDAVEYDRKINFHEDRIRNIVIREEEEEYIDEYDRTPPIIKAVKIDTESPASSGDKSIDSDLLEEADFTNSIENQKKWLEMQFEGRTDNPNYDYNQQQQSLESHIYSGPLEDIEEEKEEFERRDMSHVAKTSSLSSTPDYDILAGKKFFTRSSDQDDISMSSLQEFEKLEGVLDSSTRRSSCSSVESLNGKRPSSDTKSAHGDDMSVSSFTSLNEFEKLEAECQLVEQIEEKAKEEEAMLSEIEEGHESQVSESESCETLSERGKDSDDDENYDQRLFEIEAIIRQAQHNVEEFEREGVTLEDIASSGGIIDERTPSVEPDDSLEENINIKKFLTQKSNQKLVSTDKENLDHSRAMREDEMETSIDSLEFPNNRDLSRGSIDSLEKIILNASKRDILETSIDSLGNDGSSRRDVMETSIDSLGKDYTFMRDAMETSIDSLGKDNSSGRDADISSGSERVLQNVEGSMQWSTDSLEPTCSQATLATYQCDTDSMMTGSCTSGYSTTLMPSIDDSMSASIFSQEYDIPSDSSKSFGSIHAKHEAETKHHSETESGYDTISRSVKLPAEAKQVYFSGPNRDIKAQEFIEHFNAGEHKQEEERVDEFGNVHIQKVVQKKLILDPKFAIEKGIIQTEPQIEESISTDEHGNVTRVIKRTVISTQEIEIDLDTGEPIVHGDNNSKSFSHHGQPSMAPYTPYQSSQTTESHIPSLDPNTSETSHQKD